MEEMADCVLLEPQDVGIAKADAELGDKYVEIILPGSTGINLHKDNEEFQVEHVFFSPQMNRLAYRGKHLSQKRRAELQTPAHSAVQVIVPVEHIKPLTGESKMGFYNLETGEITETRPMENGDF